MATAGREPWGSTFAPIDLREGEPPLAVRLDERTGRRLDASGVVSARHVSGDVWDVAARTLVGTTSVDDVVVRIRPRIAVERLLFLLGYTHRPDGPDGTSAGTPAAAADVASALAALFSGQAETALGHGLLSGHDGADERDDTVDIAENQVLRAAGERLLRIPLLDPVGRHRLEDVVRDLAEVTSLVPGRKPPEWAPTDRNHRYHAALDLAELVLRDNRAATTDGDIRMDGFLVDMSRVFEDFVGVALTAALRPAGGLCRTQEPHLLDFDDAIRIQPDLVWSVDDRPAAVVDARYRTERPAGLPNADLYQLLAYCTALDLATGHLVYADGDRDHIATPATHRIRNTGITIIQHTLDLDTDPPELLAQVAHLAHRLNPARSTDAAVLTGALAP